MAMFPIFVIGLVVGMAIMWCVRTLICEAPSQTKVTMLEREKDTLKNDNEMLEKLIDKLYKKIDDLQDELTLEKNIKN